MIKMDRNRSHFYHFLSGHTTPMWFSSQTDSIKVFGGHDSIHISHKSATEQCCRLHGLWRWSKWTEIVQIFIIFSVYTTPQWFSGQTNSIGVFGRLGSIHIPHNSPTEQCCPSHRLQKPSKWTEISLIFTIFLGYTTPKCLPSRTNELKVFGRLESTHFYERHVLGAIYHRIWQ